jgi:sterol desaturase/sphingolipid hydroxylase (fatty acid hydroxylase superfamily)
MFNLVLYAAPFFVLFLALEWISLRGVSPAPAAVPTGTQRLWRGRADGLRGYTTRDTATSVATGLGFLGIEFGWKLVTLAAYTAIYAATPLRVPGHAWWAWVAVFFADDLAFYCYHRASHGSRLFWAGHVTHHSSQRYNLSTALRQPWVPMTELPFWLPLAALGFPPWMILFQHSISLVYQFFLHTERVGRLPRPVEFAFNTPSHHRVHHGSNQQYLDRNFGGILILWDRLLGTFEPEREPVIYGLTKNITTYNPARVAFHEFAAIAHDVRAAGRWHDRLAFVFASPGWTPPGGPGPVTTPGVLADQ